MIKLTKCFVGVILNNLFIMQSFQIFPQKYLDIWQRLKLAKFCEFLGLFTKPCFKYQNFSISTTCQRLGDCNFLMNTLYLHIVINCKNPLKKKMGENHGLAAHLLHFLILKQWGFSKLSSFLLGLLSFFIVTFLKTSSKFLFETLFQIS